MLVVPRMRTWLTLALTVTSMLVVPALAHAASVSVTLPAGATTKLNYPLISATPAAGWHVTSIRIAAAADVIGEACSRRRT